MFLRKGENAKAKKHRNFVEYAIDLSPSPTEIFQHPRQDISQRKTYLRFFRSKKGLTKPLSSYLEDLGFHLDLGEQFSNRVCSPCGTKVRAAAATVEVLKNLNQLAPYIGVQNERSKRMSNSPHQAQQSKILRNLSSPNKFGAQRSLPGDCYRLEECEMKTSIQKNYAPPKVFADR